MTPVLEVRNLNKAFGSVVVASDINVVVERGEHVGLIGTNGAGKTTFVNMVTGYVKPTSGAVVLAGQDITGTAPRLITRAGVSRSFQIPQLFITLTTEQNLVAAVGIANGLAFSPYRAVDGRSRAMLDDLLDRFQLGDYRHHLVSELSGGVRKLIDIALAVACRPKVLLLDEPTSGVSSKQKFPIMDIVMGALDADATVMFIEHDREIVARYARRVLAFYEGRIIADEVPEVALANETVRTYISGTAR